MLKAHITTQFDEFPPDIGYHLTQNIGADVGLVGIEHILRGTRPHQRLQHGGDTAIMGTGGQLTVGERAGSALTELNIGGWIQHAGSPKALHILRPLLHGLAPFQNDRGNAIAGQIEGAEQASRAHSGNDRPPVRSAHHFRKLVRLPLHRLDALEAPAQNGRLLGHLHLNGANQVDLILFPGVN